MRHSAKIALVLSLLLGATPALADDGVLLLGCAQDADGTSTVVVAESTDPFALDRSLVFADELLGRRCVAVLGRLLDAELVATSDITASSHLVVSGAQSAGGQTCDGCDSLIWDIDSAGVSYVQLTCDLLGGATIVAEDSTSDVPTDFVGRPCVEALAALGGLANLVRSSVARGAPGDGAKGRDKSPPVSVLIYQLALKLPSPQ